MAVRARYDQYPFPPDSNKRPRHDDFKQQQQQRGLVAVEEAAYNNNYNSDLPTLLSGMYMLSGEHYSDLTTTTNNCCIANAIASPWPCTTSTRKRNRLLDPLPPRHTSLLAQSQHLCQENYAEIDALLRLHTDTLRCRLAEATARHRGALLSVVEHRLGQKADMELHRAGRRNAALEERLSRLTAEMQQWSDAAKKSEAVASGLRASLEEALLHRQGILAPAEDAQSCCSQGGEEAEVSCRPPCRGCGERDASVLLLPCRHLCLCKDCASKLDACPICGSLNNASLQVFISD